MSLKDLFNEEKNLKFSEPLTKEDFKEELESYDYADAIRKRDLRYLAIENFEDPTSFAKFGSAEKYYEDSISRIHGTYPYDGSLKEKIEWELSSSLLDLYLFKNTYPRTTGYANFLTSVASTGAEGTYFYPPDSTDEYISLVGGPHAGTNSELHYNDRTDEIDYRQDANIYDLSENRENNLLIDGTKGNTVEFWLKKEAYIPDQDYFEFVFDNHVTGTLQGATDYGRLSVALATTGTFDNDDDQAILVAYGSGSVHINQYLGSTALTPASIADGEWHHYAVRIKSSGSNTIFDLFVDGQHNDSATNASTIGYVSGSLVATIGAQESAFYDNSAERGQLGWSKLSGSIDEVRYWKTWRTSKKIQRYWFAQVGGGTNTDISNTHLGVYYKFNEGITQTASVDSNVLDYSGRVSNGAWTGYNSQYSRDLGSAIVESAASKFEFKDPIIYSFHPSVTSFLTEMSSVGHDHDLSNANTLTSYVPAWMWEENELDDNLKNKNYLWNLLQIVGSYFDEASILINDLPHLARANYYSSGSAVPAFIKQGLESYGFVVPDIFLNTSLLERFEDRNDELKFESSLQEVKNIIYQNIYNNLTFIYKSKGTEKSFRNLLHCFGLGDNSIKFNMYANNSEYKLEDNLKYVSKTRNYINFNEIENSDASVYQYKIDSNSTSFISGSEGLNSTSASLPFTVETSVVLPNHVTISEYNTVKKDYDDKVANMYPLILESSLFGMHTANGTENDLTWDTNDYANFQVTAVKDDIYSSNAYFKLTGSTGGFIPLLTSSYFDNVYDDQLWTFSVTVEPEKFPLQTLIPGTSDQDYVVKFYGVNHIADYKAQEFLVTGSISNDAGKKFIANHKRVYVGAHRTNFTGSLIDFTDVKVESCKAWFASVPTGTIDKHNIKIDNYGLESATRNAFLYQDNVNENYIPENKTLALLWNFTTVTGSDTSGQFAVEDETSGSATDTRYGWFSDLVSRRHTASGSNFAASSTDVVNALYRGTYQSQVPEVLNDSNLTRILSQDDEFFNRNTRPVTYHMSIEKNMFQDISEEMLNMFGSIAWFNKMIGDPVNVYRGEYKELKKAADLFFEKVGNDYDFDKYVEYFKFIDYAMSRYITKLVPASLSTFRDGISTIVENFVLGDRAKFQNKFPIIKDVKPDKIEAQALGINELLYNWKFGHPPLPSSPLEEKDNCLWWKERAERSQADISSGDTDVDSDRQTMLNSVNNETNADAPTLAKSSPSGITTYEGSTYATRRLAKPYKIRGINQADIHGGSNPYENKKIGYFDAINQFKDAEPRGAIRIATSDLESFKDCDDGLDLNLDKRKYRFAAQSGLIDKTFYINQKSLAFPGGSAAYDQHQAYIADSNSLSFGADGTAGNEPVFAISAWVYMADATLFSIFSKAGATSREYSLYLGGSDNLYFKIFDDAHTINIGVTTFGAYGALTALENKWTHICATYDGSKAYTGMKLYINGSEISTAANNNGSYTAMHNTATSASVGRSYLTSQLYTTGWIDELALLTGTISPTDVTEIYNNNKSLDLKNVFSKSNQLISYWRLGDDALGSAPDYSLPDQVSSNTIIMNNFDGDADSGVVDFAVPPNSKIEAISLYFGPENRYKGDLIFPFSIYSSSAEGGYRSLIDSSFKTGVDILNLHEDSYGESSDIPMQGPFTEKFVGGRTHRHVFSNFAPSRASLDGPDNRLEGWVLELTASSINLLNADYERSTLHRDIYFRDEYAKRPINIRNIRMVTGSTEDAIDRPDIALNTTNIGNYSHTYELVMTNGRTINNRYLAESDGVLPSLYADSTAVSGVVDFTLPRRDLTGSNKAIIVNRFSAPGDASTMAEGMLDLAATEYSVYNVLPWRNLSVRTPLNTWLANHSKQFGYYSDAFNSSSWTLALDSDAVGVPYPGTSGSVSISNYNGSASFHKDNRNTRKILQYADEYTGDAGTVITASRYDNAFVTHVIPQSDMQYAWITASAVNSILGYEEKDFSKADYASSDIQFVSASDFGSYYWTPAGSPGWWFGTSRYQWVARANMSDFIPTDFVGLNTNIYEPISSSQNILGYPQLVSTDVASPATTEVNYVSAFINNDSYANTDNSPPVGDTGTPGVASLLNSILHHRDGPWGGANWKLYKKDNHPIVRYQRNHNIIGVNLVNFTEPPVTSKYKPLMYTIPSNNTKGFVSSYSSLGNLHDHFTDHTPQWPYYNLNKIISNIGVNFFNSITYSPYAAFKTYVEQETSKDLTQIVYSETIYPQGQYTYLSGTRKRTNFANDYWRDDRDNRTSIEYSNSADYSIETASIWKLDAHDDFTLSADSIPWNGATVGAEEDASGELQNAYCLFHWGTASNIRAAANYNRRIKLLLPDRLTPSPFGTQIDLNASMPTFDGLSPSNITLYSASVGDTLWEATSSTGHKPFYDSYDEYHEEGFRVLKEGTIIPEFRISEKMDSYIAAGASELSFEFGPKYNAGLFYGLDTTLTKNLGLELESGLLTLTGSAPLSSTEDFLLRHSFSDFYKYFKVIQGDYSAEDNATLIAVNDLPNKPPLHRLACEAFIKFLPYDGFYPAERTQQLARIFSSSLSVYFKGGIELATTKLEGTEANLRTLMQPYYAPGVLFNSIKSGIAVDYPTFTPGGNIIDGKTSPFSNSPSASIPWGNSISGTFTQRKNIDSLIFPDQIPVLDAELDPDLALDSTASIGTLLPKYTFAVNNFLAETLNTFIRRSGQDISFESAVIDTVQQYYTPSTTGDYKMDIVLRNSTNIVTESDFEEAKDLMQGKLYASTGSSCAKPSHKESGWPYITSSLQVNTPSVVMYDRAITGYNVDPFLYGSSFGPPVDSGLFGSGSCTGRDHYTTSSVYGGIAGASFDPFTPPYYNGYSRARISAELTAGVTYTLENLISKFSYEYERLTTFLYPVVPYDLAEPGTGSLDNDTVACQSASFQTTSYKHAMQLSASFFLGDENVNNIIYESGDKRKISFRPRWQSPVLNFEDTTPTEPFISGTPIAKGMWHQNGSNPAIVSDDTLSSQQGIRVSLEKPEATPANLDLRALLKFPKATMSIPISPLNAGASLPKFSEALIVIPFKYDNQTGKTTLYNVSDASKKVLNWAWDDENKDLPASQAFTETKERWKYDPFIPMVDFHTLVSKNAPDDDPISSNTKKSFYEMISMMRKYVFPPHLDFAHNPSVEPFVMFGFETDINLDSTDVKNIWQNIQPTFAKKGVAKPLTGPATVSIRFPNKSHTSVQSSENSHENFIYFNEDPINVDEMRWAVFKVKKRAKNNLNAILGRGKENLTPNTAGTGVSFAGPAHYPYKRADMSDNEIHDVLYSYNWPHDFYSLIELAKVDSITTFNPIYNNTEKKDGE